MGIRVRNPSPAKMPAAFRHAASEKNLDSLSKELSRSFYRLHQNSIDEELFDVMAGFKSLSLASR